MRWLAIIGVLLFAGCSSQPRDDWTSADTRREMLYAVALAADTATTTRIHRHPVSEAGLIPRAILGPKPDPTETIIASALVGLGHYWIARRLKLKHRKLWQYLPAGAHAVATSINCDNGLC